MKTDERTAGFDNDEAVDLGALEAPAPRRRGSPVVAVRVSPDLLEAASTYAEANGLTVSDVFRAGAERLIWGAAIGPTFVSGTLVVTAGGRIVQGSPSSGIGHSRRAEIENRHLVRTTSE